MIWRITMKKLLNEHFIITMFFSSMMFLIILGLFFVSMPKENNNLINIVIGFIAGYVSSQIGYYFGDTDMRKKVENNENINQ